MVSFEIFVKAMPPSLSELKVLPRFCFAFKIPDDVAASTIDINSVLLIQELRAHYCSYNSFFFTINHKDEK